MEPACPEDTLIKAGEGHSIQQVADPVIDTSATQRRHTVQHGLPEQGNQLTPVAPTQVGINSLPAELLFNILSLCATASPWALGQVCRSWNHVVLRSPLLWEDCRFLRFADDARWPLYERRFRQCAEHTGNTLTHVDMTGILEISRAEAWFSISSASIETLRDITFDDTWIQWRSSDPRNPLQRARPLAQAALRLLLESPKLESVTLNLQSKMPLFCFEPLFGVEEDRNIYRLGKRPTRVRLNGFPIVERPWCRPLLERFLNMITERITHFEYGGQSGDESGFTWAWKRASRRAPHLRQWTMHKAANPNWESSLGPQAPSPIDIFLPALEKASFHCCGSLSRIPHSLASARKLHCPSLRTLHMSSQIARKIDASDLRSLSLSLHDDDVMQLQEFPDLESLTIICQGSLPYHTRNETAHRALRSLQDASFAPRLRHLGMIATEDCHHVECQVLSWEEEGLLDPTWASKAWTKEHAEYFGCVKTRKEYSGMCFVGKELVELIRHREADRQRRLAVAEGAPGIKPSDYSVLESIKLAGMRMHAERWQELQQLASPRVSCYPDPAEMTRRFSERWFI